MAKTNQKVTARCKRIIRIRTKISGTPEKPRLNVYRSNKHIYAQIIDDVNRRTLVAVSTNDKNFSCQSEDCKCDQSKLVGLKIAEKAKLVGINQVVFDRGGNLYHGRVRAVSEGAREGGLEF